MQTLGEFRVKQALEKEGDSANSEKLIRARVNQELEKEKRELYKDLQRKVRKFFITISGLFIVN